MNHTKFKENIEFIRMVKDRPALWFHDHHLKNDRIVCNALWESIGVYFEITASAAKARWKNFRDNFRKELKKSKLRFSGNKAEEYNSSWRYFQYMFFYKDQIKDPLMSKGQDKLNSKFEPTPSTSDHSSNDMVEIVETTHDAFVREFPKSKLRESKEEKELLQLMASYDPDIGFLSTILPHLRALSGTKKILLQNLLLKTIYDFLKNCDCEPINDSSNCSVVKSLEDELLSTPRKNLKRKSSEIIQINKKKSASCENITIEE